MNTSKKPTISDVARLAGVCIGTVSRVINNKDRVHAETRKRILKVIEETGYLPSSLGRGLVLGRLNTILLVLHDIADPYCAWISKTISQRCHERGYRMLVADSNYNPATEAEHVVRARDGGVDGLIISPLPGTGNSTAFRDLMRAGIPVVAIDNRIEGVACCSITRDDREVARLAVEHLISRGHQSIAFVNWRPEFPSIAVRQTAYESILQEGRLLQAAPFVLTLPNALEDAEKALLPLIMKRPRPTAVFAGSEIVALVCMNVFLRRGIKIPDDMAIVSVGDTLGKYTSAITLTTATLRENGVCDPAVEQILRLIESPPKQSARPVHIVLPPVLETKEST